MAITVAVCSGASSGSRNTAPGTVTKVTLAAASSVARSESVSPPSPFSAWTTHPYDGPKEPGLVLGRQADAQQYDRAVEVTGQQHLQSNGGAMREAHQYVAPMLLGQRSRRTGQCRHGHVVGQQAPARPGRVVAARRTPDRAWSAITRSNERAALAPPGRSGPIGPHPRALRSEPPRLASWLPPLTSW